jgi:tetratricopeptide (TPR) repeat protein
VAGNPVGNSPAFVGRADVLREVLRVLRRPQDNAIVLYGQRRIGKTSILQHLAAVLPQEGPYRAVYFDLQDKAAWPLGRVLQDLARTIANVLGQSDPDLGPDPETAFRQEWLPVVLGDLPEGYSLVLLFDEFDVLAAPQAEQAAAAFFPYLRDLLASDPQRLQFVFVIGRNVDDLTNIALSLFKGTPARRVSLLSRKDTVDLMRFSEANGTLRWSDGAVERVWQLTCGHPFLTQQLCSHVWERTYDEEPDTLPTVTPEDVGAAVSDVLEASRNTLEWLWDGLPPAERVVASALAEAGPGSITQEGLEQLLHESGVRVVIRELQNVPQLLQEWDLIEPSDGGYRFRVELLRRWITEHKSLRHVQEELDRIELVAESLYRAGLGYYTNEQFEQATGALRQAIGLNPNHVGANQLLADILLAQGQPREAQQVLERFYEYQPNAARSRLVRALLAQAWAAKSDAEQLALYERVLELDSTQLEATTKVLEALEQKRRYQDALDLARKLAGEYPKEKNWQPDIERLERKTALPDMYQRARQALKNADRRTAQTLLGNVVHLEPEYENATRYLHLAVTGVDVNRLQLYVRVLLVALVLVILMLVGLNLLPRPVVSGFIIDQPRQLGPEQGNASVSGYLEYSDKVSVSELGIVVYVAGVKPNQGKTWRRGEIPCVTQIGRQWALSSECATFSMEYSEFSLVAILVSSDKAADMPPELTAGDESELIEQLHKYAYRCAVSTPCSSISPVFQVSRIVAPEITPTSSPTAPPTSTPTFTLTVPVTPTVTPTLTSTATATPPPPPTRTNTPLPTSTSLSSPTLPPSPTDTKSPPPTGTKPPPPTNTKPPPPTNTPRSS